ncbi:hypothetical protein HMPREF1861_00093 [Corynebacterium kroppenstedtii]|nr:hypothetical protein HMPREF1861_00093 [Corynebacterium kroppenstedtii]
MTMHMPTRVLRGYTPIVCSRAGKLWGYIGVGGENCGDMGEKWPKIDHIPPHFCFGARIPLHFWALDVVSPQFSVYRFLLLCVSVSRPRNWVPPGCYTTERGVDTFWIGYAVIMRQCPS